MDNPTLGNNNLIEDGVIIENNVKIGNNNVIKKGTVIHENTIIGNNNVFLEDNVIGALPVEANVPYQHLTKKGLVIGNNNFFHIKNIISSGCYNKTIIGNNNKFLSDVYISHDNIIHDFVTFYPRVFSAGVVEFFNHSSVGACACIHQKLKIGAYSMIGMNSSIVKNVYPYMICVNNNKYTNINEKKIDTLDSADLLKPQLNILLKKIKENQDLNIETMPLSISNEFNKLTNNNIPKPKIKITYCMCFYDNVKPDMKTIKRELTRKLLRYMLHLKNKYQAFIEFNFVLCGSEGEDSKKFVLSEGFKETEYLEFDQTPFSNILTLIENKFKYSLNHGIQTYPDYDVLMLTGSSDFIPEHSFERLTQIDLSEPLTFGVKSYKNGGKLVLNSFPTDKLFVRDFDTYVNSLKKYAKVPHIVKHLNYNLSLPLIGGVIGFTNSMVKMLNNDIPFPEGNEFETYKEAAKHGGKLIGLSDFWINIKVKGCDYHSIESLTGTVKPHEFNKSVEISNLFDLIKRL